MRLIDAGALLKEFNPNGEAICPIYARIKIVTQPIAYDVYKVVEQLEKFREEMTRFGCDGILTDMIEVVKGGGVDE